MQLYLVAYVLINWFPDHKGVLQAPSENKLLHAALLIYLYTVSIFSTLAYHFRTYSIKFLHSVQKSALSPSYPIPCYTELVHYLLL